MDPIFIGGCGRSGTTMLGSMLGSHQLCIATPESQFKIDALKSQNCEINNLDLKTAAQFIIKSFRFRNWALDIDINSYFDELNSNTNYPDYLKWLVRMYSTKQNKLDPIYWIDHTPENIKSVAILSRLFPEAKFIHIIRDGRAIAASILPLDWGPNNIINAAHWWIKHVSFGLAAEYYLKEKNIPIYKVFYEDLINNPKEQLRQICEFLEIDFHDKLLRGDSSSVPPYSRKQHSLVGETPDTSRLYAWKKALTEREIEIFESIVGDYLYYLGYEPLYGLKAKKTNRSERLIIRIEDLLKKGINRQRKTKRKKHY